MFYSILLANKCVLDHSLVIIRSDSAENLVLVQDKQFQIKTNALLN